MTHPPNEMAPRPVGAGLPAVLAMTGGVASIVLVGNLSSVLVIPATLWFIL